ncbi:TPA: hypothetical protein P1K84_002076 [Klebsiella quasipneumoniae]|nr:hypothetical protein [Klebsiella quasipneumoniae]HBQ6237063.1 hypothetical protein [Klebsiella quasipneumoniae subsp. similipneumoniae]EIY5050542.1 hypothetical protein [Klebsiella quasipneumoniae]MDH2669140.1 hypothetical protein [Klebsiella quasipneumoniae]HBR1176007.1 hypothetical protein [Klebsiella quasipneumoniae subsp. similipneumoniae]HBR1812146.1 hypothetical protein [Klebsiella quasipneumoniae subsp. similipneumoniae]
MYFDTWRHSVAGRQKIKSLFSRQRVISYIIAVIVYCGF